MTPEKNANEISNAEKGVANLRACMTPEKTASKLSNKTTSMNDRMKK